MNKEKQTKKIIIIIFAITIILLGIYIFNSRVLNNNNENSMVKNDSIDEHINTRYTYSLTKRTTIQANSENYIKVLVDTEGNAYLTLIGNINTLDNEQIKNNLLELQKKFKKYSPKDYITFGGGTTLDSYKLNIKKVLTIYNVTMGNGGAAYFIFVKEGGKISYLCYDNLIYDGKIILKDVDNLQNVVSIVNNDYSMTPYAITIDGEEIELYDYIK